jgi:hypothetical protein
MAFASDSVGSTLHVHNLLEAILGLPPTRILGQVLLKQAKPLFGLVGPMTAKPCSHDLLCSSEPDSVRSQVAEGIYLVDLPRFRKLAPCGFAERAEEHDFAG